MKKRPAHSIAPAIDLDDLERRLENWGRAMRVYRTRGRALSLEGQYRSPQRNHWEEVAPAIRGQVDYADALTVEQAWSTLDLPDRLILRYRYCTAIHPNAVRRIVRRSARVDFGQFDVELLSAQSALVQALARSQLQNRNILRRIVRRLLDIAGCPA